MNRPQFRSHRDLPRATLRGQFWIADAVVTAAEQILPTFRGPDGDHEGIAFLAGVELPGFTLFNAVIAPQAEHGPGRVHCSKEQVLACARAARSVGLSLLAQIHTHPSGCTHHSEGDDEMVLMPFEGMLSLVVPNYAHFGMRPLDGLGVHQFQDKRWVLCSRDSVHAGLRIAPNVLDLR